MRFKNDSQRKAVMAKLRYLEVQRQGKPLIRYNVEGLSPEKIKMRKVELAKDLKTSPSKVKGIKSRRGKDKPVIKLKKSDQIIIRARKWFDKVNGNTYHSTEVYINGKLVGREPFRYGYGEQYYQTAKEILDKKGYINYKESDVLIPSFSLKGKIMSYNKQSDNNQSDAYSAFEDWRHKHRDNVTIFVDEVRRKGDL